MIKIGKNKSGSSSSSDIVWDEYSDDFETRSAITTIYGGSDTGRTRLACTSRSPIYIIHRNEKIDGLVQKFKDEGKIIKGYNFGERLPILKEKKQEEAKRRMEKVHAYANSVLHSGGTVILDTVRGLWDYIQYASLGKLSAAGDKRGQLVYGELNMEYESLIEQFRKSGTNLVMIADVEDEYKSKVNNNGKSTRVATGKKILKAHKKTWALSDVVIRTARHGKEFSAVIEKAWFKSDIFNGEEIEQEDMNLPYIHGLITGTSAEEWE